MNRSTSAKSPSIITTCSGVAHLLLQAQRRTLVPVAAITLMVSVMACGGDDAEPTVAATATAAAATEAATPTATPDYVRFRGIPLAPDLMALSASGQDGSLPCDAAVVLALPPDVQVRAGNLPAGRDECFSTASLAGSRAFYEQVLVEEGWAVEPTTRLNVEQWAIAATRSQGLEEVYVVGTRYEDAPVVWIISTAEED